jgi:hypothetical protein
MVACAKHPDVEAAGTCARCGRFFCAPELILLDEQSYCGDCGVRDDVDWLGRHYAKREGKRSGLAWFLVLVSILQLTVALLMVLSPNSAPNELGFGVTLVVFALSCLASASGRKGLHLAVVPGGALAAAGFSVFSGVDVFGFLIFGVPSLVLSLAVWRDVHTRLFYRKPVPRQELRRHFEREGNNPLANWASRLALLGLFIPGLGLVGLAMGGLALARVDGRKRPPVGGARVALGAIAFSLFATLIWVAVMLPGWRR